MKAPLLFEINAEIRQLLVDADGHHIAIEFFDQESQTLQTALFNTEKEAFVYSELRPSPEIRQSLRGIYRGMIWLTGYSNPDLPIAQGIAVYDREGHKLWFDPDFQFQIRVEDRLWGFKNENYGYYYFESGEYFSVSDPLLEPTESDYPIEISYLIEEGKPGYEEALSLLKVEAPQKIWYAENEGCFALLAYRNQAGLQICIGSDSGVSHYTIEDLKPAHEGWAFVLKGKEICFLTDKSGFGIWKP